MHVAASYSSINYDGPIVISVSKKKHMNGTQGMYTYHVWCIVYHDGLNQSALEAVKIGVIGSLTGLTFGDTPPPLTPPAVPAAAAAAVVHAEVGAARCAFAAVPVPSPPPPPLLGTCL
jgi:hypothetical protein